MQNGGVVLRGGGGCLQPGNFNFYTYFIFKIVFVLLSLLLLLLLLVCWRVDEI